MNVLAPPLAEVPPMPVPPLMLPPLLEFPAAGTDQQRADWFKLADLHQREADRQTKWGANPTTFLALLAPTVAGLETAWNAHDAALNRLSDVLAGLQPLSVGGDGGLTEKDVSIVKGLADAIRPKP